MQITPSRQLLSVLGTALDTLIFPEIQSDQARATADFIRALLADLVKREQHTPALLTNSIAKGQALAVEISALLTRLRPDSASPVVKSAAPLSQQNLNALIAEHAGLTATLAELAIALAQARAQAPGVDDADAISALLIKAAQWESGFGTSQRAMTVDAPAAQAVEAANGPLTQDLLESFMRSRHPDGDALQLTSFESVPGGYGKQTTRFSIRDARGHEQALIARKMDPAPMITSGMFRIEREFHLLQNVSATGYPAPRPLYLGKDAPGIDADFYVMEKLPGRVPGSYLGGMQGAASEALVLDMAARLASLHALPLDALSPYIERFENRALSSMTVTQSYADKLATLRRYQLQEVAHLPSPYLIHLADWLERKLPQDTRRPVLVHGDFNIHNLLVEDDRVSGVLDWECAMFGAPEQDLAYIQPHISRLIDWEQFLAHYEACSGRAVDRDRLPYYLAFSMLPVSIGMNRGLRNLQTGANRDIRYAMIELAFGPQFMEMGIAGTLPQA